MTQYIKRLPEVFQTVTEKKFFDATFDQVFSKKDSDLLSGYLGRRIPGAYNPISDFYIPEPTKNRTWWQLESTAFSRNEDNTKSNIFFYDDLLEHIEYYGGNTLNQDRLFESEYYSFGPPIDYDMFVNYQSYYWVEQGLPTINITGVMGADIIGKASYTTPDTATPPNFTLTTGMTVLLVDDPEYPAPKVIENFGGCIGIGLTEKFSDVSLGTTFEFLPWDGITELSTGRVIYNDRWDMTTWEVQSRPGNGDYITIERGAIDRNAWSRTNKWVHVDAINATVAQTGEPFPSNATRALRPIIQFVANILLYRSGIRYRDTLSYGFRDDSVGFPLTLSQFQGMQLSDINETYNIQLANLDLVCWFNDVTSNSYIYIANVQGDGSVIFDEWTSVATPVEDGDIVFLRNSAPYDGALASETWYYSGGTWQQVYNEKTRVNQEPLFVLYDHNNIPLDDTSTYPNSSFRGSKIFSYKVSTEPGATVDPVLRFPIVYTSLRQSSDIVFQNNLITDRYTYSPAELPIDGYYYYNITSNPALFNNWNMHQPCPCEDNVLPDNYEYILAEEGQTVVNTSLPTVAGSAGNVYLAVYVNGVYQSEGPLLAYTVTGANQITFNSGLSLGDQLSVYAYEVGNAPEYETLTATAAQTIVPTTLNLVEASATACYAFVYLNGVYQTPTSAYNITGTNEITFTVPLLAGNDISIYSYANIQDLAPGYKMYVALPGQISFSTAVDYSDNIHPVVYVNGVFQNPSQAYSVTGPNQITFDNPLLGGDDVSVYFINNNTASCINEMMTSKQRVIDRYVIGYGTAYQFRLSVTPYNYPANPDIIVAINGEEIKSAAEQINGYTVSEINSRIYVDLSSYVTSLLLAPQSQAPVVEIQTYTHGPLAPTEPGYSSIPQQLEANPSQLEISEISGSDLTQHFVSIISNQSEIIGEPFGGPNNYRDSQKNRSVGSFILQNVAPTLKSMLVSSSEDLSFITGVRFSSDEYTKFKNRFLSTATQLINQGFNPVQVYNNTVNISSWVGEILKVLNVSKEFSDAFAYSFMAAEGTPFASESFTVPGNSLLSLADYVNLTDPKNGMYIYDLTDPTNERLLTVGVDYTVISTNLIIEVQMNLDVGIKNLSVTLYKDALPTYIPSTPTKVGAYGASIPRIELDSTYAIPTNVIIGHDGSKTIAYNDYRDNLLLDLETRIYNFLESKYRNEYYLPVRVESVKSGFFRKTRYSREEYLDVTESYLNKWSAKNRANYRVNDWNTTSLTTPTSQLWKLYNYGRAVTPTGDATDLPGNWKGIFQYYYDTFSPDTCPWEMLGFSQKPSWWEFEYGAPMLNANGQEVWTSVSSGNNVLWDDLEAGIIRQGPSAIFDQDTLTPISQTMWARPGLSTVIPVDSNGEIIPIITLFNLAYTGNEYEPFDHFDADWVYGDGSPVEQAWMSTSGYRFSLQEFMFLMKPGPYGELMWDTLGTERSPGTASIPGIAGPVMLNNNWQYVQNSLFSYNDDEFYKWFRPQNKDQIVHAEIVDGVVQVRFGYQVWISDRISFLGKNIADTFGQKIRTLDVNLANKVGGFINKATTNTYISAITPGTSTNTLIIPSNNFEVFLHKSPVVDTYSYSGIIIRALADGTFAVYGYDLLNAEFITLDRSTQKLIDVSVGGTPAEFRYFESGGTYQLGEYVRYNGVYYVSQAVQTVQKFDQGSWNRLPSLPTVGGVSVSYKPISLNTITRYSYGSILKTPQEVFDLMIGWGAYLESQGWEFTEVNADTNIINDWVSAGKQYLFWLNTNWAPDASIQLSPLANSAKLTVRRGYPDDVESLSNGVYSILDKFGVAIPTQETTTDRDRQSITVAPASLASGGIFFVQVNASETEHVIVFDNQTSFNDIVYSPLLRARQDRLKFYGFRSNGWYGKMEAPGYLIIEDELVPNYDSIVNAMRYYYDANVTIDNPSLEDLGRRLIGYESKSYLDNLEVANDVQYLFYQGVIRQKGTKQAIEKLFRSSKVRSNEIIKIFEEWALKLGNFGNTIEQVSTEFKLIPEQDTGEVIVARLNFEPSPIGSVRHVNVLNAENTYVQIPRIVFPLPDARPPGAWSVWSPTAEYQIGSIVQYPDVFGNPVFWSSNIIQGPDATFVESNWSIILATRVARAYAVLDSSNKILRVDITDHGYGYLRAPSVIIDSGAEINNLDRLYSVWQGEVVNDKTLDNIIDIDIDETDVWVYRPPEPNVALEFPVTDKIEYPMPNAGYVNFKDVDMHSFDVNQLALAWQTLNPVNNNTIWVAKTFTEDWDVLKLVDISTESEFSVVENNDGQLLLRTSPSYLITPQFAGGDSQTDLGNLLSLQVQGAEGIVELSLTGSITDIVITKVGSNYAAPPAAVVITNLGDFPATTTVIGGSVINIEIPEIVGVITEAILRIAPPESVGPATNYVLAFEFNQDETTIDPTHNYYSLVTLTGTPVEATDIGEYSDFTNLLIFKTMRFLQLDHLVDDQPAWDTVDWDSNEWDAGLPSYINVGDRVWVDGYDPLSGNSPLWNVYDVTTPTERHPLGLVPFRTQEPLINTPLFESASVFNDDGVELVQLPVYDPFKFIFPAPAKQNLSYITLRDPARYNVTSEERLFSDNITFGELQVGQLWWDLSDARVVYYEQPIAQDGSESNTDNLEYRRDYWARLFPGSIVAIYEWIKSSTPPSQYTGTGVPRDVTSYVQITTSNRFTNISETNYYFWVLGSTDLPNTENRTLAATSVANLLQRPRSQGFAFFAPIQQTETNNSYMFYNVQEILAYQGNNVQMMYRLTERDDQEHAQWAFFREGDTKSLVTDQFWNKMVDSLCGYTKVLPITGEFSNGVIVAKNLPWDIYGWDIALWDEANDTISAEYGEILPVPDPVLSELEKYGVMYRPRQGMFVKLHDARKIFVQAANDLLKYIPIRDDDPSWNDGVQTDQYWEYTNWYRVGYEDVMPTIVFTTLTEANDALIAGELIPGTILQVIDGTPDGRFVLYGVMQLNPNIPVLSLEEVGVENSAIRLLDTLYTDTNKYGLSVELRQLLNAFRTTVMIDDYLVDQNELFFSLMNYVMSEQKAPDWVFKTSYIYIKDDNLPLGQSRLFIPDQIDNITNYITDVKPYHTQLRDYSTVYTLNDLAIGTASDSYNWEITLQFGPDETDSAPPVDALVVDPMIGMGWDYMQGSTVIPWDYTVNAGPGITSVDRVVTVPDTSTLHVGMIVRVTSGTGQFAPNTYISSIDSPTTFTVSALPVIQLTGGSTEISINIPWDGADISLMGNQSISRNAVTTTYYPAPGDPWPGFDENTIQIELTFFDPSKVGYSELFPYTFNFNGLNINNPQSFITPHNIVAIKVGDTTLMYGQDYYVEYNEDAEDYTVYFFNNPGNSPVPIAFVWLDGGPIQLAAVSGHRNELALGRVDPNMVINVDTKLPVDISTGSITPYTSYGEMWEAIAGPVANVIIDAGGSIEIPWDTIPELELLPNTISFKENINPKDGEAFYRNAEEYAGYLMIDLPAPTLETYNLSVVTVFVDPLTHPGGTDILPNPTNDVPGVVWIEGERIEYKYKDFVGENTWQLRLVRRGTMGTSATLHTSLVPTVDEVSAGPNGETILVEPPVEVYNRVWVERSNTIPGSIDGPNFDIWNVSNLPGIPDVDSEQAPDVFTSVINIPFGGLWYALTPESNFLIRSQGKSIP